MSKEDIDRAVKDAEKFAEEDKKQKEAVEVKNRAESMIFQSEKTLTDIGDKVSDSDKAPVREALDKLKETVKGGDTAAIKADTEALEQALYKITEKLYQQAGAQGDPNAGGAGFDPNMGGQGFDPNAGAGGNTYYNADFEDKTGDDGNN